MSLENIRNYLVLRGLVLENQLPYYVQWVNGILRFCNAKNHPSDPQMLEPFLKTLGKKLKQWQVDQTKEAIYLFFFYRHVIEKEVGSIADAVRSRRGRRLPSVLTHSEAMALIDKLQGEIQLMAKITYGGGLRLNECLRLRVQEIDFEKNTLTIRAAKGDKDRITVFSGKITDDLHNRLSRVRTLYEKDRADNIAAVHLPGALKRKYPNASRGWIWFWLFP